MSFLHSHSCECMKSELDLFTLPPTQINIEGSTWVVYKPISSLSDDAPIEFSIVSSEDYLDLSHTQIGVRVQIAEVTAPAEDDDEGYKQTGPVNCFLHALFSQIDVFFNTKQVSPPNTNYPYRAYIETLLNYGQDAKKSHLGCGLWYEDTAGKMDDLKENQGLVKRRALVGAKGTIDLIGHLHCDVFNLDKHLLNNVDVFLRLTRSRDGFALMDSTGRFAVKILDAALLVRRVRVNPSIKIAHASTLAEQTAKYPLTRVQIKSLVIPSGVQAHSLDNIILGQLPKRVILGFITNKAYNGDRTCNPFNFQNFGINYLSLEVDGGQVAARTLQPDFTGKKLYVDSYQTLFMGTGIHFHNHGNSITREDYPDGYCLFAFDLTPDLSAGNDTHWNLIKHGSVRLDVRFGTALTETINCLVYAEYESILEIDASRQPIVDFSA